MTSTTLTGTFSLSSFRTYAALHYAARLGGLALRAKNKKADAFPIACTYAIENSVTGSAYVGSTGDFFSRWTKHLNHLQNENHSCEELQDEFNEYGADAFVIRIVKHYPAGDVNDALEFADGMAAYGREYLLNNRLGAVWLKRYPGRGYGRTLNPAKSTLKQGAAQ